MPRTTTRLGIEIPIGSDAPPDVAGDYGGAFDRVDELMLARDQGNLSARPPAGTPGRVFFAQDAQQLFYDTGAAWQLVGSAPTGAMMDFAGATAPPGWLLCNGAAVPRVGYAALFDVIGTSWGAGNGSSTFNVPDLRGRVSVGAGQGPGLTDRALGGTGGAESHQLTTSQMPSHGHSVSTSSAGNHTHSGSTDSQGAHEHYYDGVSMRPTGIDAPAGASIPVYLAVGKITVTNGAHAHNVATNAAGEHSHTGTAANNGGGEAHPNMQPFLVATKIIKT